MIGPLPLFSTIGRGEEQAVIDAMRLGPLSGYLGGVRRGGYYVERLEHVFADAVGARHAVAVNSGTSGLLCACEAVGVVPGITVVTTPYTMSATAAAPKFLGANVLFGDIEAQTFGLDMLPHLVSEPTAVIVTNLFGHPAELKEWRDVCSHAGWRLIEDSAQAILAMEGNKYAGTVGDIGVFSFNVHKHLQCGEGGVCVTDDDDLADRMRRFRNHSELFGNSSLAGLNLRMTEVTAAIALAQLGRREQIIAGRIDLAEEMTEMASIIRGLRAPAVRPGCRHVYYSWAVLLEHHRDWFVQRMNEEGIPMKAGYVEPLYRLPAFKQEADCPVVERVQRQIALFEICTWDPTAAQRKQMWEVFRRVGEEFWHRDSNYEPPDPPGWEGGFAENH